MQVTLIRAIPEILKGHCWDGSDESFDDINRLLAGSEHDLALALNVARNCLEITDYTGHTKWVDIGNYVTFNHETGELVLLTAQRVNHHFVTII